MLLITIDTLRADAISVYGGRASTPRLDALAARGARFTFAHAHAVVTLPSHTSLLTGTYPYEHGVRDNNGYRVKPASLTLATRLKSLGFATGAFVGGFPLDQRFGLNAGFDTYDDRIGEMGSTVDFALPERRADAVVSSALAWTGAQPGKWFAWVHVFDPHAPYQAPDEFAQRYAMDPYSGEVAWTDFALGPLFDRLASLPRRTLVIVTADHGESLGDHGELTHGIFAYEPTLRVPLIVAELGGAATHAKAVTIDAAVRARRRRPDGSRVRWRGIRCEAAGSVARGSDPPWHRRRSALVLRGHDRESVARMGAASRRDRRQRQVHRLAGAGALRTRRATHARSGTAPKRRGVAPRSC